jgi:hypothetical protein
MAFDGAGHEATVEIQRTRGTYVLQANSDGISMETSGYARQTTIAQPGSADGNPCDGVGERNGTGRLRIESAGDSGCGYQGASCGCASGSEDAFRGAATDQSITGGGRPKQSVFKRLGSQESTEIAIPEPLEVTRMDFATTAVIRRWFREMRAYVMEVP